MAGHTCQQGSVMGCWPLIQLSTCKHYIATPAAGQPVPTEHGTWGCAMFHTCVAACCCQHWYHHPV